MQKVFEMLTERSDSERFRDRFQPMAEVSYISRSSTSCGFEELDLTGAIGEMILCVELDFEVM